MGREEIIAMLEHYYEVDLDNCVMSHRSWIKEVAKALTEPDYLEELVVCYDEYLKEINA